MLIGAFTLRDQAKATADWLLFLLLNFSVLLRLIVVVPVILPASVGFGLERKTINKRGIVGILLVQPLVEAQSQLQVLIELALDQLVEYGA